MSMIALDPEHNFEQISGKQSKLLAHFGEITVTPLFTIFIPTYRRPDLLANAFKSAYFQTASFPYEIIIGDNYADGDDSSLQAIRAIIEAHPRFNVRIRYYKHEENLGITGNWNRGIELAEGRYYLMCHDDDWLERGILDAARKRLNRGSFPAIAFKIKTEDQRKQAGMRRMIRRALVLGATVFGRLFGRRGVHLLERYDVFVRYMNPGNSGVIFETQKLRDLGGYNDEVYPFTDYQLFARYAFNYGVAYCKKRGSHYRISVNDSLTAAKLFPKTRYQFMLDMIPFVENHKPEELRTVASCVCADYLQDASVFWGIPTAEFAPFGEETTLTKKEFKKTARMINLFVAKRYL